MRVVLMAAGIGSRLANNYNGPKSTMKIGGIPLLKRMVSMLINDGFHVSVVVGYKKEMIFDCLKNFDVTYYYNPFFRVTNSLGSLWFARDELMLNDDVILANADVYWSKSILNITQIRKTQT